MKKKKLVKHHYRTHPLLFELVGEAIKSSPDESMKFNKIVDYLRLEDRKLADEFLPQWSGSQY